MSFCIQCGERIRLDTERCPACGRLVGASSIGIAQERRLQSGNRRGIVFGVGVVTVALAAWAGVRFSHSEDVTNEQLVEAARSAARSSVRLVRGGTSAGGVALRRTSAGLLVATPLDAPIGTVIEVVAAEERVRGLVLFRGAGRGLAELSVVLVPAPPAGIEPALVAGAPLPDTPILAPNANVTLATAGTVLASDEDGVLVHDAPLAAAARGFGLWSANGRLAALAVTDTGAGEQTAFSAERLAGRLLVHEVALPPGSAWVEPGLPIPPGGALAAMAMGDDASLSIRFGDRGATTKGRAPWSGLVVATAAKVPAQPFQLGRVDAKGALAVTVVTLVPER